MKKENIKKKNLNSVMMLGYGEMAESALLSLAERFKVATVVTPPLDSDLYRFSKEIAVEKTAQVLRVPIVRTNSNEEIEVLIKKLRPQALVICSYNKILGPDILKLTKCINVHGGDLPRWRGRANFNWAIILDKKKMGVTVHEAIPNLDAGNIFAQYSIPISERETIVSLYDKTNVIIRRNLGQVVEKVLKGYKGRPQRGQNTYCCTRLPQDGYIDWSLSSKQIDRFIRGLTNPFPGAFTYFKGEKMNVWSAEIPKNPLKYVARIPGRIIKIYKGLGVEVLTGDSSIILKEVTYGGENRTADDFINTVKTSLGFNAVEAYEFLKAKIKGTK